jgi:transposase
VDACRRARRLLRRLKRRAERGEIDLVFEDESEALTHPYLARTWAKKGVDLRIEAPGQAKKRDMFGGFDWRRKRLVVSTTDRKRSVEFIAFLDRLSVVYKNGRRRRLFLVLDNGPIHVNKASMAALAAPPWITVVWLPKYAPELNDIERMAASQARSSRQPDLRGCRRPRPLDSSRVAERNNERAKDGRAMSSIQRKAA